MRHRQQVAMPLTTPVGVPVSSSARPQEPARLFWNPSAEPIQLVGEKRKRSWTDDDSEPAKKRKKGQVIADIFSRAEASMRRKVRRRDVTKLERLRKRINKAKSKPSKEVPFMKGDMPSFFHLSELFSGENPVKTNALKLQALPSVYMNTRKLGEPGQMTIKPPFMMVDPGGDYLAVNRTVTGLRNALETSDQSLNAFMLAPWNEGEYTPNPNFSVMDKESDRQFLGKNRDAVALKFRSRVVEPIRREGVFTQSTLELLKEKDEDKPSLKPLIGDRSMMVPTNATQWFFNDTVNQQQLPHCADTGDRLSRYQGENTTLTNLVAPTQSLMKLC